MNLPVALSLYLTSIGFAIFNIASNGNGELDTKQLIQTLITSMKAGFFLLVLSLIQSIFILWLLNVVLVVGGIYFLFTMFKIIKAFESLFEKAFEVKRDEK